MNSQDIINISNEIIETKKPLSPENARKFLEIKHGSKEMETLCEMSRKVREAFCGGVVYFCSIINAKAGNCSENCAYCTQANKSENDDYEKHSWMDDSAISVATSSAVDNGAGAIALVAAWKGVREGKQLDMVCDSVKELAKNKDIRTDVNLGILQSQKCADKLKDAGVAVYGHNLETAKSFYKDICTTHSFDERRDTVEYIKKAGMGLCSGGILGMGENLDQRIEFALQLAEIEPKMIPINFLNPLPGTKMEGKELIKTDDAIITLATYRLMLPERSIMVAGGKEVVFGDRLGEALDAGINAVMVGNYLTSLGTTPEFWHEEVKKRGLKVGRAC